MSQAKAPPRKRAASPAKAAVAVPEEQTQLQKRTEGLMGLGQLIQGGCMMFGQYADAGAIGTHFPNLGVELAKAADSSEVIAKPIDFLIELGPYAGLIAAGMPLVLQLMANHRMLNAGMLMGQGVVSPEVLDAQMKARMAQMQAEAMRAQQEAIQQAQQAQQEYDELMRPKETAAA
jgi:hypothetical protein